MMMEAETTAQSEEEEEEAGMDAQVVLITNKIVILLEETQIDVPPQITKTTTIAAAKYSNILNRMAKRLHLERLQSRRPLQIRLLQLNRPLPLFFDQRAINRMMHSNHNSLGVRPLLLCSAAQCATCFLIQQSRMHPVAPQLSHRDSHVRVFSLLNCICFPSLDHFDQTV